MAQRLLLATPVRSLFARRAPGSRHTRWCAPLGGRAAGGESPPPASTPQRRSSAVMTEPLPRNDYEAFIPGLLHWVSYCNNGAEAAKEVLPLTVAGATVGYVRPEFAKRHLQQFPDVFQASSSGSIQVHPQLATQQARTAAIAAVLEQLREEGVIDGWRNELYPAVQSFHDEPAFLLERAAAPHFGIKAYGEGGVGVHRPNCRGL